MSLANKFLFRFVDVSGTKCKKNECCTLVNIILFLTPLKILNSHEQGMVHKCVQLTSFLNNFRGTSLYQLSQRPRVKIRVMQSASSPASGPAYETVGGCTGVLGLSLTLIFTQSL